MRLVLKDDTQSNGQALAWYTGRMVAPTDLSGDFTDRDGSTPVSGGIGSANAHSGLHTLVHASGPLVPMAAFFSLVTLALPHLRQSHVRANDIAEAVRFMASGRATFISGQHLDIDGGHGV